MHRFAKLTHLVPNAKAASQALGLGKHPVLQKAAVRSDPNYHRVIYHADAAALCQDPPAVIPFRPLPQGGWLQLSNL